MQNDERQYEQVGNIRIKQIKTKNKKVKKDKKETVSLPIKIFIWFMFFAMLTGFVAPLVYYFVSYVTK